jgi:outer membrane protein assembly factor BamE (lipoprotein component of BamABCDE complex)
MAAVALVAGCLAIPIPTPEHGLLEGRGMIDDAAIQRVTPGVTTREEVLLQFGEPDAALRTEQVFVYRWSRIQGYVPWAIGGYYTGAAGIIIVPRVHLLLIEFDEGGRVTRFEHAFPRLSLRDPIDRADEWAGQSVQTSPYPAFNLRR